MASHGYIPFIKNWYVQNVKLEDVPTLIEVGVDKGAMIVPLITFLTRSYQKFVAVGVDIIIQDHLPVIIGNTDRTNTQNVYLIQGNSLEVLPKLKAGGLTFNIVLLDGDHNYYTVSKELEELEGITTQKSIVVIDDYEGRWSDKDLWYSERPGYESVGQASKKVETEKHGVKAAVEDWLITHPHWTKTAPIVGEPVVLSRLI
jgi:cephalosporin hydroxylase